MPTAIPGVGEAVAPAPGGTAKLRIPLRLSAPSAAVVRVHWATEFVPGAPSTPEPQAPATDYRSAHGVLVFAPGKTFADATIEVTGDAAASSSTWWCSSPIRRKPPWADSGAWASGSSTPRRAQRTQRLVRLARELPLLLR